jgi:hypothetical protein
MLAATAAAAVEAAEDSSGMLPNFMAVAALVIGLKTGEVT